MKRRPWVPLVAVGLALLILVPTTFAVGEPGTTLYAQLGTNRFPGGSGAADASLTFNGERDIVLRIQIAGPAGTVNAVRVYVDGTCTNPGIWVINRTPTAGPDGPFLTVNSNSGVNTIQVNQLDVDRIRAELVGNPNETFALMVARLINGVNYRTCTSFRTTPFPPLTTTTATTRTSTVFSTGTTVRTVTLSSGLTTITLPTTLTSTTTSTGFSTGTTTFTSTGAATTVTGTSTFTTPVTQTITTTSTGVSTGTTTFFIGPFPIATSTFTTPVTQTITTTSTGVSTGTTTSTSTIAATTVTGTSTPSTPVTTQTITITQTTTLGTVTTQTGGTTFTTTSLFTTPVTTVTTTL